MWVCCIPIQIFRWEIAVVESRICPECSLVARPVSCRVDVSVHLFQTGTVGLLFFWSCLLTKSQTNLHFNSWEEHTQSTHTYEQGLDMRGFDVVGAQWGAEADEEGGGGGRKMKSFLLAWALIQNLVTPSLMIVLVLVNPVTLLTVGPHVRSLCCVQVIRSRTPAG